MTLLRVLDQEVWTAECWEDGLGRWRTWRWEKFDRRDMVDVDDKEGREREVRRLRWSCSCPQAKFIGVHRLGFCPTHVLEEDSARDVLGYHEAHVVQ